MESDAMGGSAEPAGPPSEPAICGGLVEYRPGRWVQAAAVVSVEAAVGAAGLAAGVPVLREQEAGQRARAGLTPGPATPPDLARVRVSGVDEWWPSPYPVGVLVVALAKATTSTRDETETGRA